MYITLFIFGLLIHCEIPKSLTFLFIDLCNVRLTFKIKKKFTIFCGFIKISIRYNKLSSLDMTYKLSLGHINVRVFIKKMHVSFSDERISIYK